MAPRHPGDLAGIAASAGTHVLRAPGPSGYASLEVPPGMDRNAFLRLLHADSRVAEAVPDGIVHGASDNATADATRPRRPRAARARWHLLASNPPLVANLSAVTVALLDTGVAYEERDADGIRYRQAPSLAGVRFTSPWDFINGDAHPNDDHQHGTHLASLLAAEGPYPGIAPHVTLMPIKVLDEDNVGTELALVDGLAHAVAHGANVINMSLSFGPGYVPSRALVAALEHAAASGAVLVAAAGNDGGDYVSQPAANPLVVAVGANRPEGGDVYGAAPYSNASPRVDLMAPGGSVDQDRDGDGLLDGVIGETIALGDPSRTGYWLYAGTSQATALVSGAAAHLVGAGYDAAHIRVLLQASAATEPYIRSAWLDGRGRGRLDISGALALGHAPSAPVPRDFHAAVLAWLAPGPDGQVRPAARLTVLDERLGPAADVQVVGMFTGATDAPFSCVTDPEGMCVVEGAPASSDGGPAWTVSVDDVVVDSAAYHPRAALFAGEGLQALVAEMRTNPDLLGAVPMLRWRPQNHPLLGPIAASFTVSNLGTGIATAPMALVFSPPVLSDGSVVGSGMFEIHGAGPASTPVEVHARAAPRCDDGPTSYTIVQFSGVELTALVLDATGLADTPLHLSALDTFSAAGARAHPLELQPVMVATGLDGDAIARNAARGTALAGTPLGALLQEGGWTTPNGEPVATALAVGAQAHLDTVRHARIAGSMRHH